MLFKLVGEGPVLTLHLEHPISLTDASKYRLALYGFYSENNFANLSSNGTVYFWTDPSTDRTSVHAKALTLHEGHWTLETLQAVCRDFIKTLSVDHTVFTMTKMDDRVTVVSPIKYSFDSPVRKLLGFDPPTSTDKKGEEDFNDQGFYYEARKSIKAARPPNLRAVDAVEIHCNLIENSYSSHDEHSHKHKEHRVLYTFFPAVPHGYKISETPRERYYAPLDSGLKKIQEIQVVIVDQDNRPILNPSAKNIVYLHLTAL